MAPQQPVAEPLHDTTFNHVGSLGPTQRPHQAQIQHENLMKVLQIQQVGSEKFCSKRAMEIRILCIRFFVSVTAATEAPAAAATAAAF